MVSLPTTWSLRREKFTTTPCWWSCLVRRLVSGVAK